VSNLRLKRQYMCRATSGHYYAYCRPDDGEQWVHYEDDKVTLVRPNAVITKDAYVLFFRRVSDPRRTLESLRASDDRCREDSSWMQELGRAPEGSAPAQDPPE